MSQERFKMVAAVYVMFIQDGKYSLPAGHLDGDEPVRAAAAREAREETGIDLDPEDLEAVHVLHRFTPATGSAPSDEYVDFFFTATRWDGVPRIREPDKCDELLWAGTDRLPPNTIPYIRHVIEHVHRGNHFSEYGWPESSPEISSSIEAIRYVHRSPPRSVIPSASEESSAMNSGRTSAARAKIPPSSE